MQSAVLSCNTLHVSRVARLTQRQRGAAVRELRGAGRIKRFDGCPAGCPLLSPPVVLSRPRPLTEQDMSPVAPCCCPPVPSGAFILAVLCCCLGLSLILTRQIPLQAYLDDKSQNLLRSISRLRPLKRAEKTFREGLNVSGRTSCVSHSKQTGQIL